MKPLHQGPPTGARARGSAWAVWGIALGAMASGCVHVAAQQRGTLAQPMMTADDLATGLQAHVRAVSEGATGGLGGGGGGCGCN
jgi:hypothetical protein